MPKDRSRSRSAARSCAVPSSPVAAFLHSPAHEKRIREIEVYTTFQIIVLKDAVERLESKQTRLEDQVARLQSRLHRVEGTLGRLRAALTE